LENGRFIGGGTLVARNWVLTNIHVLSEGPSSYSLRFGVLDDRADATNTTNLRQIDRIVRHPSADLAMAYFADPVPEDTFIPRLAQNAPEDFGWAIPFGWGHSAGHILQTLDSVILRAAAAENLAAKLQDDPRFAQHFGGIPPLVMNHRTTFGDSGSGVFATNWTLLAIHEGKSPFFYVDDEGQQIGDRRTRAAYELPVWRFRDWIQSVINGEGTSGQPPDSTPGRDLTEEPDGQLPMTQPPHVDTCEPGETGCTFPGPRWALSTLTGAGNYRGTALAVCAPATPEPCTFNTTTYPAATTARLPLGPAQAPGTAPRQVMVWCRTTASLTPGTPTQQVLRISFTNAEHTQVPTGRGWWDITPDQLGTNPIDPSQFTTC
jgi:hypothetical protein